MASKDGSTSSAKSHGIESQKAVSEKPNALRTPKKGTVIAGTVYGDFAGTNLIMTCVSTDTLSQHVSRTTPKVNSALLLHENKKGKEPVYETPIPAKAALVLSEPITLVVAKEDRSRIIKDIDAILLEYGKSYHQRVRYEPKTTRSSVSVC